MPLFTAHCKPRFWPQDNPLLTTEQEFTHDLLNFAIDAGLAAMNDYDKSQLTRNEVLPRFVPDLSDLAGTLGGDTDIWLVVQPMQIAGNQLDQAVRRTEIEEAIGKKLEPFLTDHSGIAKVDLEVVPYESTGRSFSTEGKYVPGSRWGQMGPL